MDIRLSVWFTDLIPGQLVSICKECQAGQQVRCLARTELISSVLRQCTEQQQRRTNQQLTQQHRRHTTQELTQRQVILKYTAAPPHRLLPTGAAAAACR